MVTEPPTETAKIFPAGPAESTIEGKEKSFWQQKDTLNEADRRYVWQTEIDLATKIADEADRKCLEKSKMAFDAEYNPAKQLTTKQSVEKAEADHKSATENARWHTWTSADGSHTIEAKFVKAVDGTIYLEKKDGTTIQVQREKLIGDDWTWIKNKSWNIPTGSN